MSSLLNIYIDEVKQILLTCGLIYYQRGTLKLVLNGWSIFMMDNDLQNNYFDNLMVDNSIISRGIYIISVLILHETIQLIHHHFFLN